jgi:hypothetical protein
MALIGLLAIHSCKHVPDSIIVPPGSTGNNGTLVCFESDILPILQTNCAKSGCHDAASHQGDYILNTYDNIIKRGIIPGNASNSKIYKTLFESGSDRMPPPPNLDLTASQKALIGRWINEGAKNSVNCSVGCDTTQFKYNANIKPIMSTYCTGCHSGGAPSGNLDLTTYTGVNGVAITGRLVGAVTHSIGYAAMPKDQGKLKDCQIKQIQKWVNAGALNN